MVEVILRRSCCVVHPCLHLVSLLNTDLHKRVIEKQKTILDRKKLISESVLKALDIRVALTDRKAMRAKILSVILNKSDKMFTDTSKLGKDFAEVKLGS